MQHGDLQDAILQGRAQLRRWDARGAEACFRRALGLDERNVEALREIARICMRESRFEEAVGLLERLDADSAGDAGVLRMLASAYEGARDFGRAAATYERCLALSLNAIEVRERLAAALYLSGDFVRAEVEARIIRDLDPGRPGATTNLCLCLIALRRYEDALSVADGAPANDADTVAMLELRACAYVGLRRCAEAASARERALALDPRSAAITHNLGVTYGFLGRLHEARRRFEQAVEFDPENPVFHFKLWNLLLQTCDYASGWPAFERWLKLPLVAEHHHREFAKPRWAGDPKPGGTLLAYTEHGRGDSLLMLRFLEAAKRRFQGRLVVEARPEMVSLIRNDPAVDDVVESDHSGNAPAIPHDAVIGLMNLPALLQLSPDDLPVRSPSAWASRDRVAHWQVRLAAYEGFRVGVCWTGNPGNDWNPIRACPLEALAPLAAIPGVRLFSLQKGFGAEQAAAHLDSVPLIDIAPELTDFNETAAAILNLDLVISVETSVAHLAGALGAKTWTLLAKHSAWMWMTEREDSPWHPSMRLYRQSVFGDWSTVIEPVAANLARIARERA